MDGERGAYEGSFGLETGVDAGSVCVPGVNVEVRNNRAGFRLCIASRGQYIVDMRKRERKKDMS